MSEYDRVRTGRLVLKGHAKKAKKRRREKKDREESVVVAGHDDTLAHGGWWRATRVSEVTGTVAVEFGTRVYVKALDNGLFTLGAPHPHGEGPSPEEILTAFPIGDAGKVAFKSGYGKYLGVDKNGVVVGRSDAVGVVEQWEPVFQDDRLAVLNGSNDRFVSVTADDDVVCRSATAGSSEFCTVRSVARKTADPDERVPTEERGSLRDVEVNYVKKFQKFQDKKLRVSREDRSRLQRAKQRGNLHEALLDRRSKMKADRYCK
ncbi:protein FRG1 homolog [Ceratina calcarata]|uniref:Protein FRG1 homolog n=1 Tax=Ceratina calcarata TaxID=156304 RepID=A0AAJ7JB28_9HYME|nr:protein FRG1 homolog [Ceratina calcarata]